MDRVITRNSSFFRKYVDSQDNKFDLIKVIEPVEHSFVDGNLILKDGNLTSDHEEEFISW